MTSFILVATDKEKRKEYTLTYCQEQGIHTFDVSLIEKDTNTKTQSIGIEDIKLIQKKIFLKPIKSPTKAVIIEDAHLLTIEAQNALLKVLEEPPEHTIIVLATKTKEVLLPTIISRCQIITLEEETTEITAEENSEYTAFIEALPTLSIGERLKKAELLAKDKEKALEWLGKTIMVMREHLVKNPSRETVATVRALQSLYALLKTTNTNPRFAIENTLLSISSPLR